jgi:Tol biopolymer transport system component
VAAAEGNGGRQQLLAVSIADGSAQRIGNRDWGNLGNVAWAPDGSGLIAVVRDNSTTRKSQVWFIPFPTGEPRQLTEEMNNYQNEALSVSQDGTIALLRGHFTSDIWVAPINDPKPAKLALQGIEPGYEGADGLAWTRDGRLLYSAYVGDSESILEINSDGGNLRQLTSNVGEAVDRQMVTTADGRYIVFQSTRSGSLQLWRANADGTNLKQLTSSGSNSQPSISPDGQWIVYTSEQSGKSSLCRVSIDGGQSIQVLDQRVHYPQISPDGKSIAYFESLSSSLRIVVIPFIVPFKSGEVSHSFSLPTMALARRLHWTADGKAIIYRDSPNGLWRQPLDGGEREPIKGLETVPVYNFALSFDGKSLAYTRGVDMREIVLLRNPK